MRNGPSNILFFTFRDEFKCRLPKPVASSPESHTQNHELSSQAGQATSAVIQKIFYSELMLDFITGSFVGAIISTIFYPLNVIRTHMQTQKPGSRHISMIESLRMIHQQRDGSLRKLYRGVHVNYSRSFLSWGIINACYELFHRILQRTQDQRASL